MSFEDLGLAEPLVRALNAANYTEPTAIQLQAIPPAIAGRDLQGCAQTGTGKTAAFALPLLDRLIKNPRQGKLRGRLPRALVLSPTRELAGQIHDSVRRYGRHAMQNSLTIYGGVSQVPQVKGLNAGQDVLIATPGRLCDLMQQGYINLSEIEVFVLDEADRMLDMGFMPDIRRIIAKLPQQKQTLLFSATMPPEIQKLASQLLHDPVEINIEPERATADGITQSLYYVPTKHKPELLASVLKREEVTRAVVFVRTKHGCNKAALQLEKTGLKVDAIHGNKSQSARQRTLYAFKNGHIQVLVATDVAARGLDVTGVSHVINYDLPMEPETYVHRIGRTGRAGKSGIAISFCDDEQRGLLRDVQRILGKKIPVENEMPDGIPGLPANIDRDGGAKRAPWGNKKPFRAGPGGGGGYGGGNRSSGGSGGSRGFGGRKPYRSGGDRDGQGGYGRPQGERPARPQRPSNERGYDGGYEQTPAEIVAREGLGEGAPRSAGPRPAGRPAGPGAPAAAQGGPRKFAGPKGKKPFGAKPSGYRSGEGRSEYRGGGNRRPEGVGPNGEKPFGAKRFAVKRKFKPKSNKPAPAAGT